MKSCHLRKKSKNRQTNTNRVLHLVLYCKSQTNGKSKWLVFDKGINKKVSPKYQTPPTSGQKNLVQALDFTFDTIVFDCEGCYHHIVKENLQKFRNIKKVILE